MSISTINKSRFATDISFSENKMTVFFEDGRELSVPLEWFPRLRKATLKQLNYYQLQAGRFDFRL